MARTCYLLAALVALAAGQRAPSGAFDRAGVEHRPDEDEIRRIQQDFTRNRLISQLSADLVLDDELTIRSAQFNAHSYQTERRTGGEYEEPVRPVERDPASVTRTGDQSALKRANSFVQ